MPEELTADQKTEIALAEAAKPKSLVEMLDEPRDLQELLANEKKAEEAGKKTESETKKSADDKASIAKATDLLGDRLGFRPAKKDEKKQDKPADTESKDEKKDDKAEADKTEKKEEVKDKKVNVRKKVIVPEIDPIQVATDAAKAVLSEFQPKKEEPKEVAVDDGIDLTDEEKDELEVFKEMAEQNPSYKDLPKKYVQSIKRIEDYRQKWEKDNPDQEFDPNDEAHNAFYDRITPSFNERDFRKAEARMAAKELVAKTSAKAESEQAGLKSELAKKELEPTINSTRIEAAAKVLESINPEYLKMVSDDKDGFKKFQDQDPLAAHALVIAAQRLGGFIEAAHQIDEPQSRIRINTEDPNHREYVTYLMSREAETKNLPLKEQFDEQGRKFATRREIIAMNPTERAKYWYFTDKRLISDRVADESELAKEFIVKENERMEKIARTRGWKVDSDTNKSQTKTEDKEEATKKTNTSKSENKSPESSTGGTVDATASNEKKDGEDFLSLSEKILFRR